MWAGLYARPVPMLAGIPVTDDDTETLVELLRHAEFPDTADKIERGLALGTRIFALTITDRESMLWALDEAPTDGLAELRWPCVVVARFVPKRCPHLATGGAHAT